MNSVRTASTVVGDLPPLHVSQRLAGSKKKKCTWLPEGSEPQAPAPVTAAMVMDRQPDATDKHRHTPISSRVWAPQSTVSPP